MPAPVEGGCRAGREPEESIAMRQAVRWRPRFLHASLLAAVLAIPGPSARAQVGAIGFGQVGFGQVGFGQVGFGQVGFNQVYFPQVVFPQVVFPQLAFPMVNPLGGPVAAAPTPVYNVGPGYDSYRLAKYAMGSARFDAAGGDPVGQANMLLAGASADEMRWRGKPYGGASDRYSVRSGRSVAGAATRPPVVRLEQVTSRGGDVLWPLASPVKGELRDRRSEANRVIKELLAERRKGTRPEVPQIVAALDALDAYVKPAAEELHRENSGALGGFLSFAAALDGALRDLAGGELAPAGAP